jgi:RsiW-degrading membrane proteinase PrsW (M82 family)
VDAERAATALRTVGAVAAGSLFWLQYFDLKDALQPEPRRRLAQAFALGAVAAGLAWGAYRALGLLGLPKSPPRDPDGLVLYCLLAVGPIEEGAKFFVARAVCFRWKEFDERIDGLVYAASVALGFAAVENLVFLPALPWREGLLRATVSPLTHSLFAALWGFGASRALVGGSRGAARFLWQAGPLAGAMAFHGLYDMAILVHGWTVAAAGLVAALWAFVIWNARRVVKTSAA